MRLSVEACEVNDAVTNVEAESGGCAGSCNAARCETSTAAEKGNERQNEQYETAEDNNNTDEATEIL
jgi:hypothetical protein